MSFSYPLVNPSTPYYDGAATVGDIAPTAVGIAGREYPIDMPKYRHRGLPSFRDSVVSGAEPSDQQFDVQAARWRARHSFHAGAGQQVIDLEDDANPSQFYASRGIDPWTKFQACLLPDVEQVKAVALDGLMIAVTGTHVYARTGTQQVQFTADLVTWTTVTGMAAEDIVDLTSDGTSCYIATTGHIYSSNGGAASSVTSASPTSSFNKLAFVANRLLAGDGELLVEVGASTLDTIYDHYQSAFRWTVMFAVGSRIYVGGYAGNRSELFTTLVLDDGSIVKSSEAASFFPGELLNDAMSYGGVVILATSKGVRLGSLGSDSSLQYGPLIDDPGNVQALAAEGRFVWFGWESFPETGSGLGRMALDEFTETLAPAFATDVFTEDVTDDVVAAGRFNNRTLFAVAGDGIYATDPGTYVTDGWLDTGEVYFGTVENKSVSEMRAQTAPLATGQAVTVVMSDAENGVSIADGSSSSVGSVGVAVNAEGEIVNRISARITLTGPGTSTPCLRQWRARAYPIGPPFEEWIVPLIIDDVVIIGSGQGQHKSYDVWDEVERIKGFWQSREVVTYSEGQHAHRVRIDNFEFMPSGWRDDADWLKGILVVRLLSV